MKHKCDKCDRPATVHEVEIVKGQKIEKHLCDLHAQEEGLAAVDAHAPIEKLLTHFVKTHSGSPDQPELTCEHCGQTFAEFREHSLLGCPQCYDAFESPLSQLIERAHEGGTHHIGKTPRRIGSGSGADSEGDSDADHLRHQQLIQMRRRLDEAVKTENYELAARLRDDIESIEEQSL